MIEGNAWGLCITAPAGRNGYWLLVTSYWKILSKNKYQVPPNVALLSLGGSDYIITQRELGLGV